MLPVFVYGILRPGEAGFVELGLEGLVERLGLARVTGTLHDLGDYPGAVLDGGSIIYGDLILPQDETVLAMLDAYELFDPADPAGSEYLRVPVMTADGGVSAWIYAYICPLDGSRPIPGGDWLRRTLP